MNPGFALETDYLFKVPYHPDYLAPTSPDLIDFGSDLEAPKTTKKPKSKQKAKKKLKPKSTEKSITLPSRSVNTAIVQEPLNHNNSYNYFDDIGIACKQIFRHIYI